VTLTAQGGENDFSFVDYVRISYWHTFIADNDALRVTTPGKQQVSIGGFTSGAIRVLDVTDPNLVQELVGQIDPQKNGFAVRVVPPGDGQRIILAISDANIKPPSLISLDKPSSWRTTAHGADLLIITQSDFMASIEPLKALRQSQGLAVTVVDVEDVYD